MLLEDIPLLATSLPPAKLPLDKAAIISTVLEGILYGMLRDVDQYEVTITEHETHRILRLHVRVYPLGAHLEPIHARELPAGHGCYDAIRFQYGGKISSLDNSISTDCIC